MTIFCYTVAFPLYDSKINRITFLCNIFHFFKRWFIITYVRQGMSTRSIFQRREGCISYRGLRHERLKNQIKNWEKGMCIKLGIKFICIIFHIRGLIALDSFKSISIFALVDRFSLRFVRFCNYCLLTALHVATNTNSDHQGEKHYQRVSELIYPATTIDVL